MVVAGCGKPADTGGGDNNPTNNNGNGGGNEGGGETTPSITFGGEVNTSPNIAAAGGSATVSFTATTDWTASVAETKAVSWCSVYPTSGAAGNATVTISVQENTDQSGRSATVTLASGSVSKVIKVTQEAAAPPAASFSLEGTPSEVIFGPYYGLSQHWVATTNRPDWQASSDQSWCRASKTDFYSPDICLSVSVDMYYAEPSFESQPRRATVTIKDGSDVLYTMQVIQDPSGVFDAQDVMVSPDGGECIVSILTNCVGWTCITELDGWDAQNHDNSWFTAERIGANQIKFTIQPWDTMTQKPKSGKVTLDAHENQSSFYISYYDPSIGGEGSGYGDGAGWD